MIPNREYQAAQALGRPTTGTRSTVYSSSAVHFVLPNSDLESHCEVTQKIGKYLSMMVKEVPSLETYRERERYYLVNVAMDQYLYIPFLGG